jgi:transposase
MKKKRLSAREKAEIAIEAIKEATTISELSSRQGIHPNQITRWKNTLLDNMSLIFTDKRKKENQDKDRLIDELYKTVGQRDIELEWLKKKLHINT